MLNNETTPLALMALKTPTFATALPHPTNQRSILPTTYASEGFVTSEIYQNSEPGGHIEVQTGIVPATFGFQMETKSGTREQTNYSVPFILDYAISIAPVPIAIQTPRSCRSRNSSSLTRRWGAGG
jgi:hypothetical protein